uniref:Essential meiotic structure-specific endonuclease 1 n=1 Tax=Salarias fasciatus TaxID=181472 RepID=A0A672GEG9_SALFA
MASSSDSSSDLDEELPVFDFLLSGRQLDKPQPVNSDGEELAAPSSVVKGDADVMMISSDSDDDAPYVPLAQRLQQRRDDAIRASSSSSSSTFTNGKISQQHCTAKQTTLQLSHQNGSADSYRVMGVGREASDEQENFPLLPPVRLGSPVRKKAAKRTAGEIQASREEALKRRRQQQDKEALRQEQQREKAERRALAENAKALRPEECIKHMVVAVDPALLQLEGGGTLLDTVQALGCSCAIEKQAIPRSVSWMRRTPCAQTGEAACVPEAQVVMQMTVEDFITLIHGHVQRHGWSGGGGGGPSLTSWVQERQKQHPDKLLSLVVIQLDKYFKSHKSKNQKSLRDAVLGEEAGGGKPRKRRKGGAAELLPEVSRVQVEEALVHLQLHTGVSVHFVATWQGFSDHVAMTTKAVAEAPFKRQRDQTGFSFHLESEWAGGQRVDRAGKGLLQVWKRQIQQLHRVSPDMAAAIFAAFPSPQLLKKAYSQCSTERDKVSLLSELLIRRGEGVTSTTRRVGPELSKRLYLLMNSSDPEQTLDSNL